MARQASIARQKTLLRAHYRKETREIMGAPASKRARELRGFFRLVKRLKPYSHVALFAAAKTEVNLLRLNRWARLTGRTLSLPCVIDPGAGAMIFVPFLGHFQLRLGYQGIREIGVSKLNANLGGLSLNHLSCVLLVPGLAFDLRGQRLGQGGGFYDRYLARVPQSSKLGIGFKEQLHLGSLPCDARDERVDALLLF